MPDREKLEKVLGEFYDCAGEAPDLEELVKRHPDLAEEIRAHFDLLEMVDRGFDAERSQDSGCPRRIGEYRIVREIGRGGMGVVYEAEQVSMGRRVALKVLSPSVTSAAQAVQRFEREARAAGKLRHQNIAPVFGMGQDSGLHYYAMELVDGRSLGEVISELKCDAEGAPSKDGPFGTTTQGREHFVRLAEAAAGVAEALHSAHEEGVVHRDVKPTNLLLAPDGTLKLVDFGLARLAGEGASMTVTGQILGTPHYMSPEQAMARQVPIDYRTDIYSLGATLYESLTLKTPFTGDSLPAVYSAILHRDPSPPRKVNPRIPQDLETIVLKAMEKDRERRYSSAEEMAKDLRLFAVGMTIRARRIGPIGRTWRKVKRNKIRTTLVAAVVLLAVAGGYLAQRSASEGALLREAEYDRLIARAEDAMASETAAWLPGRIEPLQPTAETSAALLSRAIEIFPERADGYWLRALAAGRTIPERLEDLDRAEQLGLARGSAHLLRACFYRLAGRATEAGKEAELAAAHVDNSPLGLYAKARLLSSELRRPEAVEAATAALGHPDLRETVRTHALRVRAHLRVETEDWTGAQDDFTALKTLGDDSIRTRVRIAALWKCLERAEAGEEQFEAMLREADADSGAHRWMELCWACANANEMDWFRRAVKRARVRHERDQEVQHAYTWSLMLTGRRTEALDAARSLAESHPDNLVSQSLLASALQWNEKYADSLAPLEYLLENEPRNGRSWLMWAAALTRCGEHDRAEAALQTAIGLDLSNARAQVDLGILLLKHRDRADDALLAFKRACESTPRWSAAWYWKGRALEAQWKLEEAVEAYLQADRLDPTSIYPCSSLGCVYVDLLRKPREGLRWFKKYSELAPDHAAAWQGKGSALEALGRIPEAITAYEKGLQLVPDEFQKLRTKARLHFMQGQFKDALAIANHALKLDPDHTEMLNMRGTILCDLQRNFEGALEAFDHAIRINPRNPSYHHNRGTVLCALGDYPTAIEAFTRCLELDPGKLQAYQGLATCHMALGEPENAADDMARLRRLQPESLQVLYALVTLYRSAGETEKARAAAADCSKCDPGSAPPIILAWLCAVAGDRDGALGAVERVAKSSSPGDLYNLACVYAILEEKEQALEVLEKAIDAGCRRPPGAPEDVDFASLQRDPRYMALLERLQEKR